VIFLSQIKKSSFPQNHLSQFRTELSINFNILLFSLYQAFIYTFHFQYWNYLNPPSSQKVLLMHSIRSITLEIAFTWTDTQMIHQSSLRSYDSARIALVVMTLLNSIVDGFSPPLKIAFVEIPSLIFSHFVHKSNGKQYSFPVYSLSLVPIIWGSHTWGAFFLKKSLPILCLFH